MGIQLEHIRVWLNENVHKSQIIFKQKVDPKTGSKCMYECTLKLSGFKNKLALYSDIEDTLLRSSKSATKPYKCGAVFWACAVDTKDSEHKHIFSVRIVFRSLYGKLKCRVGIAREYTEVFDLDDILGMLRAHVRSDLQ